MDKYLEVIKHVLELINSIEEGLFHMESQIIKLQYEESVVLLQDAFDAVVKIEESINLISDELKENDMDELIELVYEKFDTMAKLYNDKSVENLSEEIGGELIPRFLDWKTEVEKNLLPYTIS